MAERLQVCALVRDDPTLVDLIDRHGSEVVPLLISSSNRRFDRIMLIFCSLIGLFLLSILLTCKFAALAKFYPYELSLGLKHYRFDLMDGGGFEAYGN